ncbi:GNAT family N-acetyltransferase [Halobacillus shinanisalinarum]|uniref:GNAT family N-acetyltransferase n=1 Tax=Halobacillus shinanisalinarum TaxID=2932258 RepID=A0ABY4GXY3_9BACI|nr:GNAT family N-acetyltransferase [Halobacillus shinanisalinarum]UOQ93055.1 GNAT family N-acetyltransferase [Halobacillus shinanisalinarum]
MEFSTRRIRFIPISIDLAQLIIKNPLDFFHAFHLPWDKNWPHDGLKAILPLYIEMLEEDQDVLGYGPWVMIDRNVEEILGDIGFKGKREDGVLEIGYQIVTSKRNQGLATEAVKAMCDWAFQQPGITGVEAECDERNIPSQKVLINSGFAQTTRKGNIIFLKKEKFIHDKEKSSSRKQQ